MIFVTLGTNDKSFERLLKAVEGCIKNGIIDEEVIVQSGFTQFHSDLMKVQSSFPQDEFEQYINDARLIITHGGVGTIMTSLKKKKTIIAAARLAQYHEHVNDHQIQLLEAFDEQGYLIYAKDLEHLDEYLKKAQDFTPAPFESNTNHLVEFIEHWIETH